MKYSKQERLELGRKIHESGLSDLKAGRMFGISEESARRYRILYEQSQGIEHETNRAHNSTAPLTTHSEPAYSSDDYASMTKEELIEELMKARIREARLKKGYMVRGVGKNKEYILLDMEDTE